jgi:PAS domain S-box-containing protein
LSWNWNGHKLKIPGEDMLIKFKLTPERLLGKNYQKTAVMALLTLLCAGVAWYFHFVLRTGVIFSHFFYVPIVLAGFWWGRKGVWEAALLGIILVAFHFLSGLGAFLDCFLRSMTFVVVGLVVGTFREQALRSEKGLREARDYLSSLIRYANAPIIAWNGGRRITQFNQAFERLTGYTAGEVIGRELSMLFPAASRDESLSKIARASSGEYGEAGEVSILRKDGTTRLTLWNLASIYAEDGATLLATIAQGMDITESKQAEEALRKAHEELEGQVAERTAELVKINKALEAEIAERLSAEQASKQAEIERRRLLVELEHRSTRLQTAVEVFKSACTILDPDAMMSQSANLIQERFHFYYVGLFLMDETRSYAVLRVGTGEAGQQMLAARHQLAIGGESIIGWCIANAQARIALDVGKEAVRFDNPYLSQTRSEMALPLISRGQVLGALTVQSIEEAAFSKEDVIILQTMADQLAIAIENARLYQEARRQAGELAALIETDRDISASLDMATVLRCVAAHAQDLLEADDSEVYLLKPGSQTLRAIVALGEYADKIKAAQLRLGEGIVGRVAQSGIAEIVNDVEQDSRSVHIDGTSQETHALICAPLISKDRVIGVIALARPCDRGPFETTDLNFLISLARHATLAIENARLFEAERMARERAETLQAATQALSATLDLQRVFELILSELHKVLPYDSASVQQIKGERLKIIGGHGFPNLEEIVGLEFDLVTGDNPNREVVRTKLPFIVDDAPTRYDDFHCEPHVQAGIRSWLGVPLLFGDRLIGIITLDKKVPGFYTEEHAQLALAFAAQAAVAIENARLYEAQRQQTEDLAAISAITRALSSSLEMDTLLRAVTHNLGRLVAFDRASLAFANGDRQTFTMVALEDSGASLLAKGMTLRMEDSAASESVLRDQTHVTDDLSTEIEFLGERMLYQAGLRSRVNVPLTHAGQVIASLNVASLQAAAFGQREVALLGQISGPLAIAIENARLYTEAQERAKELAAALAKLEELDCLKSEFIQNVSHELRTPISIILGYAELLNKGELGKLQPDQREPVAIIARRGWMLGKLVNDLATILAAEAGKIERVPVDLAGLGRTMLADFRMMAEKAELAISAEIMPGLPLVLGDPTHLRRVLDNLLGNALKFTPAGGVITVSLRQEGANVVLKVADTGIGIPPDKLGHVFDRFYQVDGSMRRRYGGVGLGLALVKEIVEAHGGQVTVESELGQGSVFTVTLPVFES